jgi:glycosyltransferase involved in cell wall biosynthesis
MSKKISIITINYNNLEGLKKTFESIFTQTFQDFEYIVIDGGSTDGSREYIEKHQYKITYWVSEKDNGVYNAMNKGIVKANGEYLNFMNSGDWFYENNTLEKVFNQINDEDIVYGNAKFLKTKGIVDFILPSILDFNFFYKDSICHQASYIKKELFLKYGFYDESFKIVSDWKFFSKCICLYNVKVKYINDFLCNYDFTGISSNFNNYKTVELERNTVFNKDFKSFINEYHKLSVFEEKRVKQFFNIKNKNSIRWKLLKFALNILKTNSN